MPQKPIFTRYPLVSVPHGFISCGQARTSEDQIIRLYQRANNYLPEPEMWEGLFRIACLICNKPADEPVASQIRNALRDTADGSFEGSLSEQVFIVRSALALFEYNSDRQILRRIAVWCRFLEIEWDQLTSESDVMLAPADLMETLIRFYQYSGIRSVLRLCARLRSNSFDWTTALHTFQQSIPLVIDKSVSLNELLKKKPSDLEYDEKQLLLNHAGYLAGGFRYSFLSGLFSGNGQDLSSGKTAWSYLQKHHRAICGGTTSSPFLSGSASDQPVSNQVIASWTEAFASQLLLKQSDWALDELIRLIHNGLSDCLNPESPQEFQYVNTLSEHFPEAEKPQQLYAGLCRAVASVYQHAVTLTENGIRFNYLLPGKILVMIRKQPVMIRMDRQKAIIQCHERFDAAAEIFYSATETSDLLITNNQTQRDLTPESVSGIVGTGRYIPAGQQWDNGDEIFFSQQGRIISEACHHQGVSFFVQNNLLSFEPKDHSFAYAVNGTPSEQNEHWEISASPVNRWHISKDIPADIPVLPKNPAESVRLPLTRYSGLRRRITMFPRSGNGF